MRTEGMELLARYMVAGTMRVCDGMQTIERACSARKPTRCCMRPWGSFSTAARSPTASAAANSIWPALYSRTLAR